MLEMEFQSGQQIHGTASTAQCAGMGGEKGELVHGGRG